MNKDITINEVSGGEGPQWTYSDYTYSGHHEFSHFTHVIYYITLQIYFGYNLICIFASSVPMNYFYLLQLFFGDFFCNMYEGFLTFYGISRRLFLLGSRVEINNQDYA